MENKDLVKVIAGNAATEDSEEAFSWETVPLDVEESETTRKAVITHSHKKSATTKAKVEKRMEKLFKDKKVLGGVTVIKSSPKEEPIKRQHKQLQGL